jgi:hypothetical protein
MQSFSLFFPHVALLPKLGEKLTFFVRRDREQGLGRSSRLKGCSMKENLYRVMFRGEMIKGVDPEQVKARMKALLRFEETAIANLFSGRPVTVKSGLDLQTARKYQGAFEKAGALSHIESSINPAPSPDESHDGLVCPKCGLRQVVGASCLSCGIIFEKYRRRQAEALSNPAVPQLGAQTGMSPESVEIAVEEQFGMVSSLKQLMLSPANRENPLVIGLKAALLLGLAIWGARFVFSSISSNYAGHSFMHLVNLPFHEAGHIIFRPFGRFITSLGGSLGQVLMPAVCLITLLVKTRDAFGAAVCLWWAAENFIDIAPYINDARAGIMPLLGGNTGRSAPYGFHDWQYILTETGLLRYDHVLARACHGLGTFLMLLAIAWAALVLYREYQSVSEA